MGLEIQQQLKLSQQLVMTPQLQQAIRLLQLSRLDLVETVHQELLENPFLEEADTASVPEEEHAQAQDERSRSKDEDIVYDGESSRNEDWEDYLGEFASSPRDSQQREIQEEEGTPLEMRYAEKPTLSGHLLWQLHLSQLSPKEVAIGEAIIGNLASSGYLQATVDEIAQMTGASLPEVEKVLRAVQLFDPVGVAARDARECLLIQLHERELDGDPVLVSLVSEHLEDFEARRYKPIMKKFHLDEDDLKEYIAVIQSLDPMPGASFGGGDTNYVSPDVFVRKIGSDFVILLNEDGLPHLRLSEECDMGLRGTEKEAEYCAEKKKAATWLIRSIEQRNRTLYRVTESIVRHQRDFFEQGVQMLKPLILRDIAEDIGMHESTVSRITTNKYVATPFGIFELKFFFTSGVKQDDGSQVAAESVKDEIRRMISEENPADPLSDDFIARDMSKRLGIKVARRTVAKYRTAMDIPSSSKRKKLI